MKPQASLPVRDGVAPSFVWCPNGPWQTIGEFFLFRFPAISRDRWALRAARGELRDERGIGLGLDSPYRVGACVFYYREPEVEVFIPFKENILFQNSQILVVDKPHFLPVIPGGRFLRESLLVRLKHQTGLNSLVPIHRLDRETAGVMLFSIDSATRNAWQSLFRDRRIKKIYEALAGLSDGLSLPLIRRSRLVRDAQFFRMKEVLGEANTETGVSLTEKRGTLGVYKLEPVTGKMHQLRVHMSSLGIPIINDRLYPTAQTIGPDDFSSPLKLLARSLSFTDPISGDDRVFESRQNLF